MPGLYPSCRNFLLTDKDVEVDENVDVAVDVE